MRFGAHLPIAALSGPLADGHALVEYAETAETLGFTRLCANDHLVFSVPWTDGLIALGLAAGRTSNIGLMTTAALLAVRGAAPLGSAIAALHRVSQGRFEAAVTPGSGASDYDAVGLDFGSRWSRFDTELPRLRGYLETALPGGAPPIWVASWGSEAGLRRVARLGDGWLASAYHGTPEHLAASLAFLRKEVAKAGKNPDAFPVALATTYMFISDDPSARDDALKLVVRPADAPSDILDRLLIGTSKECADRLLRLMGAGIQEVLLWPLRDEIAQLRRFAEEVVPRIRAGSPAA